jgi:O-methyltransferase
MQVEVETAEELYLDLLKKCLTRLAFEDEAYSRIAMPEASMRAKVLTPVQSILRRAGLELVRKAPASAREQGRDWPPDAETMIGMARLDNIQACVVDVIRQQVPGDLIETGVWRGGATILMRGILRAHRDTNRVVWVADSFQGLPRPSGMYEADLADDHWRFSELAVSADDVRRNFERYGLLDDQVQFLEGFFQDTLASAPIEQLALLRLDGDMYESTIVALRELYPKVSPGGYVIVDDYLCMEPCRRAVDDYRREHAITDPIVEIDWTGVFWQRQE